VEHLERILRGEGRFDLRAGFREVFQAWARPRSENAVISFLTLSAAGILPSSGTA
jgi:hypothetical protein